MVFTLLKSIPEEKIIGEDLGEGTTYDIIIDIDKKDLIIESEGFSIWRRFQTYEELYNDVVSLVKDIMGDDAVIYMGQLPKDVLGLRQPMQNYGILYTIPEKKKIGVVDPSGVEVFTLEFDDAESYFKALDKYAKMLKN